MKKLEQNILEMLFGCLLGDALIGIRGGKVYITFEQTLKHKDYVMHIYDLLSGVDGLELSNRRARPEKNTLKIKEKYV